MMTGKPQGHPKETTKLQKGKKPEENEHTNPLPFLVPKLILGVNRYSTT